jgi:hypothetical protein
VSIPAVTTRFDNTKHDIRKGRKTGSPVSGWRVESTIFLACQSSGVMVGSCLVLYWVRRDLAAESWDEETKRVRGSAIWADCSTRPQYVERSYCEAGRSREPGREEDMIVVVGDGGDGVVYELKSSMSATFHVSICVVRPHCLLVLFSGG